MTIHHYEPERYHNTIGPHEPVLCIASGDSVVTTTADAWGGDANGQAVAPRGNPQTGPFFVEGAQPGDTLAITFDRLLPNRSTGFTRSVVAEQIVDPGFVRELPEDDLVIWQFDAGRTSAHVMPTAAAAAEWPLAGWPGPGAAQAAAVEALGALMLPLAPMLGCFGVAPEGGQAISTATSGPHGGNMDYRGFTAGTTAYLPVAVPGALFFLGDGHALQGDGEIVGTGIETTFEVQFTARVIRGRAINWPRGEDAVDIFTVGNARPLDQALQHATTEMLHWLAEDYSLSATAASILLGQCVRYEIGNVFDPAYTVVCKLAKRLLETVRQRR